MFKNILNFLKGKDFLSQTLIDFQKMLDCAEKMFELVCTKLLENKEIENLRKRIYDIDHDINNLQREIRKRVFEHLALQPAIDISTSLILMSVVKDAERLGDYAKNLYEVTTLLDKPLDKVKYEKLFGDMDKRIKKLFKHTKSAFIDSDETRATKSWKYEKTIAPRCDKAIFEISKSDFSVNEAVCLTLIARYYKRIMAHLTNIASSVVLSIADLDYFDEDKADY